MWLQCSKQKLMIFILSGAFFSSKERTVVSDSPNSMVTKSESLRGNGTNFVQHKSVRQPNSVALQDLGQKVRGRLRLFPTAQNLS